MTRNGPPCRTAAPVSIALQVAGLRPDTGSNQVRIPVAAGRTPVEVALEALRALVAEAVPA